MGTHRWLEEVRAYLEGVNHPFAARIGAAVGRELRNVRAGASFVEVPSVRTCGERRARGEQYQRQSCNHGFHFQSP